MATTDQAASGSRREADQWTPGLLLGVAVTLLLGLFLRGYQLTAAPLWLDEAYSVFAADRGFRFIWQMVPRYEMHPPLYYSLLSGWQDVAGTSMLARRLPGLLCGMGTIALTTVAATRLARAVRLSAESGAWLAIIASALVALSPLALSMSRDVRPYALMMLAAAVAMPALIRLARDSAEQRSPGVPDLATVFVAEAVMMWLHSLGPLHAAAMTLALAFAVLRPGLTRRDWGRLVVGQLLVGILYLPALLIAVSQAKSWAHGSWIQFRPDALLGQIGFIYFCSSPVVSLLCLAAVALGVIALVRIPGGWRLAGVLLSLAILPMLASILLSILRTPVFLDRPMSPVVPPMLLLAARGLTWPGRWRLLPLAPLAAIAGVMGTIDHQIVNRPIENWYGAADWLRARWMPSDVIWAYPNEVALPLDDSLKDRGFAIPSRAIPVPVPALDFPGLRPAGIIGTVSLYPKDIIALANNADTRRPATIWLVRRLASLYDPHDVLLRALERNRTPIARFSDGPIDIVGLSPRPAAPAAAAVAR